MTPLLPLLICWIGGAALIGANGRDRKVAAAAVVLLVAVTAADLWLLLKMTVGGAAIFETTTGDWPAGIGIRLRVDALSLFFGTVCGGVLAAVMQHESRLRIETRQFPGLILLMCAGLHGLFFTGDLFNFYVFFEVAIVASFALAAYGYGRAESRGAFIYMAVNLLGSVIFLVGVTSVYHGAGTLDFALLAQATENGMDEAVLLSGAALLTAFALKLGLFPFHGWVPVVYSHSRPPVAAALAGALVNIGAYGLLRIGWQVFPQATADAAWLLLALGAAGTLYGALLALRRQSPAELAAYVAIAQAGYILLGLGAGGYLGVAAVLLVVLTGALDKTVMFLALDVAGRARRFATLVAAISVAGLPFTIGFVAKVQLFNAGAAPGGAGAVVIGTLLVSTPLTIAAGFRYWRLMLAETAPAGPRPLVVSFALPAISILFGLAPNGLGELAAGIGVALLGDPP